jgi:hypothetical protein
MEVSEELMALVAAKADPSMHTSPRNDYAVSIPEIRPLNCAAAEARPVRLTGGFPEKR